MVPMRMVYKNNIYISCIALRSWNEHCRIDLLSYTYHLLSEKSGINTSYKDIEATCMYIDQYAMMGMVDTFCFSHKL